MGFQRLDKGFDESALSRAGQAYDAHDPMRRRQNEAECFRLVPAQLRHDEPGGLHEGPDRILTRLNPA
jgi:hypothetical protein